VFARAHRRFQSERLVAPFGLVAKTTTWYLVWAGKDAQLRVDHVSRVIEASLTAETFERPESFNLAAFWEDWCRRQEENRPRFLATLRASLAVLPAIEDRFGDAVARIPAGPFTENEKGWAVVRVPFSSVEQARSHILAYGGAVEVLEPRALRLTVADFAGQIRKRYRKRG